jgi:putative phosphoribosyl transferase
MDENRHARDREGPVRPVEIPTGGMSLPGDLAIPAGATGVVLFVHGSGSSRHSPRNKRVARTIQASGIATLLFDLLSPAEEREDAISGRLRFNIGFLAKRLAHAAHFISGHPETRHLGMGFFGASTGGAAALAAASDLGAAVQAVVSRGGRPDLAGDALSRVNSPTLLIVGELDEFVLRLNRDAYAHLRCQKRIALVPRATHLFGEPGALDEVASLATEWFNRYLKLQ